MKRTLNRWLVLFFIMLFPAEMRAGGSGLNVVLVVNQNSTNSVQLGNYYRQLRNVPPQNYLRINWTGTNTEWLLADYTNTLFNPLLALLAANRLTNQIDYVVLSMDIPYRINGGTNGYSSTTSALFYGFKNDPGWSQASPCEIAAASSNLYAGSEEIFPLTPPSSVSAPASNSFLATMITGNDLSDAELVVSQGAASDATFPTQTTWLSKSSDPNYNVRYTAFDNAVFNARLRGNYSLMRTNLYTAYFNGPILGYQNGFYYYSVSPVPLFVPGAMADNLASFGGQLFENTDGETTLLTFLAAGAAGSFGTVEEPCNYLQKFPDPQNYFFQARGFSLGECYYQSVTNPYQGLVCGEPLAAPFAKPGAGAWSGLVSNATVSGLTNLAVQFIASDALHPLQQVDLFLDGNWLQTVTNIAPQSGNVLKVALNGYLATYTVPSNATLKTVTSNLVAVLNGATYQNNTKILATDAGDRINLQSIASYTKLGSQIPISAASTNSSGALTTFINPSPGSPTNFLDTIAYGLNQYEIEGTPAANAQLTLTVTKTNNTIITVTVTNNPATNTLGELVQDLFNAVTNTPSLQGLDGLYGGDLQDDGTIVAFTLNAISPGYAAAQIKAAISATGGLLISPSGTATLTQNQGDLEPRNHLYLTAGVTNLPLTIPFNTTNFADGYHELTAVAYEGSHVRTQTRATQDLIFKNRPLSATFSASVTGSNSALQPALLFTVAASPTNISSIQLFSTGGLLSAVTNQPTATFSVNLTNLNIGVHPFYAIVTDTGGHQYRTQTYSIGLTGVAYAGATLFGIDYPFTTHITSNPLTLTWPATAGRSYNILNTTNLLVPFTTLTTVVPNSALGQWTVTNNMAMQQFYRISVVP